jgi:hypothetical protein
MKTMHVHPPTGPAGDDVTRRAQLQVAAHHLDHPDEVVDLLRMLGLPTTKTVVEPAAAVVDTPRSIPPRAPAEHLPDVLEPRQAAAIARRAHRNGQPVPERVARLLAHHRATRRTA